LGAGLTEHDDIEEGFEPWPGEVDPIRAVIGSLLVVIMEGTADGSPERKRAMSEALGAHERIKDAMRVRSQLH
jgi:hypothetical protein